MKPPFRFSLTNASALSGADEFSVTLEKIVNFCLENMALELLSSDLGSPKSWLRIT